MKDYRQFIKQLPSNTIVCALGEFNPPTTAHELLIKTVQVVAEQRNCDHVVFLSPSETLQEDRKKLYYMKRRKMIQHRQKEIIVVTKGEIS